MSILNFKSFVAKYIFILSILFSQVSINEFMASNNSTLSDNYGNFDDWIELGNAGLDTVNLFGWYLSDDYSEPFKYVFTDSLYLYPDSVIILWADNNTDQGPGHLNFKLSSQGEEIILTDSFEVQIDYVEFEELDSDISYGRYPDFNGDWGIMNYPTPGEKNSSHDPTQYAMEAIISPESGIYLNYVTITLSSDEENASIYYTLDGSIPFHTNMGSSEYSEPLLIDQTTILRTIVYIEGLQPSKVQSHHYIINENFELPIVALGIDPDEFPIGNDEYDVYITYFEKSNEIGFKTDAGIERHGSPSSQNPYIISFKSEYGSSFINYPLFEDRDYTNIKRLVLRNASNDRFPGPNNNTNRAHMRDILIHDLYRNINPGGGYSSFQSAHVYINNDYWGIYHIREKQDKYYIKENFGYDNIDLLERAFGFENNRNAIEGDWLDYDNLEIFIENQDMTLTENFEYLKSQIRYQEFLDYWILQIFVGNFDWLSNNVKFFRPKFGDDKWRWLLWDVDHGIGMDYQYGGVQWGSPETDYLEWSTGFDPPRVWNGENNRIIRAILRNEQGKLDFINRFQGLLNTHLLNDKLLKRLDSLENILSNDMDYHAERWDTDIGDWYMGIGELENYILERNDNVIEHLKNKFDLDITYNLTLNVVPFYPGAIRINNTLINHFPWTGKYFSNLPMEIKAEPNQGFIFSNWHGLDDFSSIISLESLDRDTAFTLELAPISNHALVINEFLAINNGNHLDEFGEPDDFIEIHNGTDDIISLHGLQLTDDLIDMSNYFIIEHTESLNLEPGESIVFWADNDIEQGYNHLNFKLNGDGENIYLLEQSGTSIIDSVIFGLQDANISFGRYPDGSHNWVEMTPTPNTENIGIVPEISIDTDTIILPDIYPYDTAKVSIQIANIGIAELFIENFYSQDEDFRIDNNLPYIIPPGAADSLQFIFTPKAVKELYADVYIGSNDPKNYSVQFLATGSSKLTSHAVLYDVSDVSNDQGFNVIISFLPSKYDGIDTEDLVEEYVVWRYNPLADAWDSLITVGANGDTAYYANALTFCNSIHDEICLNSFRISSKLLVSDSIVWSNILKGQSTDDLAPDSPTGLGIEENGNILEVTWNRNNENDIAGYLLEISRDSLFLIPELYPINIISDTLYMDTEYEIGDIKYYRLSAVDISGNKSDFSSTVRYPIISLSNYSNSIIPVEFELHQNHPNPFNPITTIKYDLPEQSFVSIRIYDLMGRIVKNLIDGKVEDAGFQTIQWDAVNDYGNPVSAGVYLYTIETKSFTETKKLLILK